MYNDHMNAMKKNIGAFIINHYRSTIVIDIQTSTRTSIPKTKRWGNADETMCVSHISAIWGSPR